MKKKNILLSVAAVFALAAIATAVVPPPPVNQNIGIYDTSVNQFQEPMCRACHNSTYLGGVPTRHHNLVANNVINPMTNQTFQCTDCHPVVSGSNGQSVLIDRNCIMCHNGSAFYANPNLKPGRPHHNTTYAQVRNCKFCHGGFVDSYNDGHYIPAYNESIITPSITDKVYSATSGRHWGGCLACHQQNLSFVPNIMGPVANIGLGISDDNNNTHHLELIGVTQGSDCSWCHRSIPPPNGINSFFDIRACEDCHSVATIHNIQYNYTATNGQLGYGHIGNNWDCNGCHAFWDAGSQPFAGAIVPDIFGITPSVLTAGQATSITISGTNFVQDAYTTNVVVDGTNYTPSSITNSQIAVNVPPLRAGVHNINIVKSGSASDSPSKLLALTVVGKVTIASANLRSGVITITGMGFGNRPTKDAQQYVTIAHGGNIYYSQGIIKWSNSQIKVKAGSTIARTGDLVTVTTATGGASAKIR